MSVPINNHEQLRAYGRMLGLTDEQMDEIESRPKVPNPIFKDELGQFKGIRIVGGNNG